MATAAIFFMGGGDGGTAGESCLILRAPRYFFRGGLSSRSAAAGVWVSADRWDGPLALREACTSAQFGARPLRTPVHSPRVPLLTITKGARVLRPMLRALRITSANC